VQRQSERAADDDRHTSQSSAATALYRCQTRHRQHAETAQGRGRREDLYPFSQRHSSNNIDAVRRLIYYYVIRLNC